MMTGFGVGLDRGVTPRSQQGNLKVTGRSNQIQIGKNSLFLLVLLQFNSLEMSMVVETHLYPRIEIYQNTPKGYRVATRLGGGGCYPIKWPLCHPSSSGRHGLNNSTIVMFEPMAVLQIHMMNPNPNTHFDMCWGWA